MKKLPMNLDIKELLSGTLSSDNHHFAEEHHACVDWLANNSKVDKLDTWSDICKVVIRNLIVFNRADNNISDLSKDELKSIMNDNIRFYRMLTIILRRTSVKCQKVLAAKPSDDYDSMSKEELIALLRSRK